MKRVISLLLSIVMVISMLPVSVFATDTQPEDPTTSTQTVLPPEGEEQTPDESEPAPSESEPAPSESEPAPSESEPVPGESEPAPSESEPAPSESVPAPEQKVQLQLSAMTGTAVTDTDVGDSDELLDGFVYKLFYGDDMSAYGNAAGNRLSAVPKALYDGVKAGIEAVVSGGETVCSTSFTVDAAVLRDAGATIEATFNGTQEDLDAKWSALCAQFLSEVEYRKVVDALLYDCAYELFWFDKSVGYGYSLTPVVNGDTVTIQDMTIILKVVKDMQPAGYDAANPTVDVSKAANAQEALDNAQNILTSYQHASDFEKLNAFKNEICSRVSYDYDAVENGVFSLDADPWQLISVFDNSTDTNVVCEGYSKAFQYLCERSGLETYLVTGYMDNDPNAGHMWNVVTLDGKNYIADITNTDNGMAGMNGSLFLNGYDAGSLEAGYVFNTQSESGINTFTYDADTLDFWGTETLTLSAEDYTVPETEGGEDGGEIGLPMTQEDFFEAVSEAVGPYVLTSDVTITGNYTMNKPVTIAAGATLTVAEGGRLGIHGAAWSVESSLNDEGITLIPNGKLINNGTVELTGGAVLTIAGGYGSENNGTFHVGMGSDEAGTLEIDGIFSSSGYLCVQPAGTLNLYEGNWMGIGAADNKAAFLQCNGTMNVYGSLDISDLFVVDTTSEITATLNIKESGLFYNYEGAESAIEADGVLNLEGEMFNASTFVIKGNATIDGIINAYEDGKLSLEDNAYVVNNGTIYGEVLVAPTATLVTPALNADQFQALIENAERALYLTDNVVLDRNMTIGAGIDIYMDGGSITIPESYTLTLEEGAYLGVRQDSTLVVNGTLETNRYYSVNIGGKLIVGPNGTLDCGNEHIAVKHSSVQDITGVTDFSKMLLCADIDSADTLSAVVETGKDFYSMDLQVSGDLVINQDITLPDNAMMQLDAWQDSDGNVMDVDTLTVAAGYTLTNEGTIIVGEHCTVTVLGSLVNKNQITLRGELVGKDKVTGSGRIEEVVEVTDVASLIEALEKAAESASDKYPGEVYLNSAVTLEAGDGVVIPANVSLYVYDTLTVSAGAELTVAQNARLAIYESNGKVVIEAGESLINYGTIFLSQGYFEIEDGFYNAAGPYSQIIHNPAATMFGVGYGFAIYQSNYSSEEELVAILEDAEAGLYKEYWAEQYGEEVIVSAPLTIPAKAVVRVSYESALILESASVNNGTIEVFSSAELGGDYDAVLTNNGQIVMYGEGAVVSVRVEGNNPVSGNGSGTIVQIETYEELEKALADAAAAVQQNPEYYPNLYLGGNVTVPAGKTLTIPAQVSLWVNGALTIPASSRLVINNRGYLGLSTEDSAVTVASGATMTNNAGATVEVMDGVLNINGTYTGTGYLVEYEEGSINTTLAKNKIIFVAHADDINDLEADIAAYADLGYMEVNINTPDGFVFSRNITIPANVYVNVGEYGGTAHIVSGVSVTVNGGLIVSWSSTLDVAKNAKLIINGLANVQNLAFLENYGTVLISDTVDAMYVYGTINNYGNLNGFKDIYLNANEEYGNLGTMNNYGQLDGGLLAKIEKALASGDTYNLTEPLNITEDTWLHFDFSKVINVTGNGSINVADGVELYVSGVNLIVSNGGTVSVGNGNLVLCGGAYMEVRDGSLTAGAEGNIDVALEENAILIITQSDDCVTSGIENFLGEMTSQYMIRSEEELLNTLNTLIPENGCADHILCIDNSFAITKGWDEADNPYFDIPANVAFLVLDNHVLTVDQGAYMCFNGMVHVIRGGQLNVNGVVDFCNGEDGGPHFATGYINVSTNSKISVGKNAELNLYGVTLNLGNGSTLSNYGVIRNAASEIIQHEGSTMVGNRVVYEGIMGLPTATSQEELIALCQDPEVDSFEIAGNVVIDRNLEVTDNPVRKIIYINHNSSLTVAGGAVVSANFALEARGGAVIIRDGSNVTLGGEVNLLDDSVLTVEADSSLVSNNYLGIHGGEFIVKDGAHVVLGGSTDVGTYMLIEDGASVFNCGKFFYWGTVENYGSFESDRLIQEHTIENDVGEIVTGQWYGNDCVYTEETTMTQQEFEEALAKAAEGGEWNWLRQYKEVVLTEDLVLNQPIVLDFPGSIIVTNGATLTVNSVIDVVGGRIEVQDGSKLINNHALNVYEGDLVIKSGATLKTPEINEQEEKLIEIGGGGVLTIEDGAVIDAPERAIRYFPQYGGIINVPSMDYMVAYVDIYDLDNLKWAIAECAQDVETRAFVKNSILLEDNMHFPGHLELNVNELRNDDGTIYSGIKLPAGATLTNEGRILIHEFAQVEIGTDATVNNWGTVVLIGGKLILNENVVWNGNDVNNFGSTGSDIATNSQELYDWLESGEQAQIEIVGDIVLEHNIVVREGQQVFIGNGASLTVPGGYTLCNEGNIVVRGGKLIVDGYLENYNYISIEKDGYFRPASGSYYSLGVLFREENGEIENVDKIAITKRYFVSTEEELRAAAYNDGFAGIHAVITDDITLSRNFIISSGIEVYVDYGTLTVPSGNTLTICGKLQVQGAGTLVVQKNAKLENLGELHIFGRYILEGSEFTGEDAFRNYETGAGNYAELKAALESAGIFDQIYIHSDIEIPTDAGALEIPAGMRVIVNAGLNIPAGVDLLVNGQLLVDGGTVNMDGDSLVNNGRISVYFGGEMNISTDVQNVSGNGTWTMEQHGFFNSENNELDHLIDLMVGAQTADDLEFILDMAADREFKSENLYVNGSVSVDRDLTVPAGTTLNLEGHAYLSVEDWNTLTNDGIIRICHWNEVTIRENADFVNNGKVQIVNGEGRLLILSDSDYGTIVEVYTDENGVEEEKMLGEVWVYSEGELRSALRAGYQIVHICAAEIYLTEDLTLNHLPGGNPQAQKLILEGEWNDYVQDWNYGVLRVPAGRTLTLNSRLNIHSGGELIVDGTLINNVCEDGDPGTDDVGIWNEDGGLIINGSYEAPNGGYAYVTSNYGAYWLGNISSMDICNNTYVYDEQGLRDALADSVNYGYNQIVLEEDILLTESITIPDNVYLGTVGSSLIVPSGKLIINYGVLEVEGDENNPGKDVKLIVAQNASLYNFGILNIAYNGNHASLVIDAGGKLYDYGEMKILCDCEKAHFVNNTVLVKTITTSVNGNAANPTIAVGTAVQLNAAVTPTNATQQDVRWSIVDKPIGMSVDLDELTGALIVHDQQDETATLTVRATALDSSEVYDELQILVREYRVDVAFGTHTYELDADGNPILRYNQKITMQATADSDAAVAWALKSGHDQFATLAVNKTTGVATLTAKTLTEKQTVEIIASAADGAAEAQTLKVVILPKVLKVDISTLTVDSDGNYLMNNVTGQTLNYDLGNPNNDGTMQLIAFLNPIEAGDAVAWSSSAPAVATVDEYGFVTIRNAGTVKLTAKALDGSNVNGFVSIKVVDLIQNVVLADNTPTEVIGGKNITFTAYDAEKIGTKLTGTQIKWSLRDEDAPFATIAATTGTLTTKKVSEKVTVMVRGEIIGNEQKAYVTHPVTIYPLTTQVEIQVDGKKVNDQTILLDYVTGKAYISGEAISYMSGPCISFDAELFPHDVMPGYDVKWTSSSATTAKIDAATGMLEGIRNADGTYKTGTVTITAAAQDGSGKNATVKVQIGSFAQSVTITPFVLTHGALRTNEYVQLTATTYPEKPTTAGITWSLTDPTDSTYVTLSTTGRLTAKAVTHERTVVVRATSKDGMAYDEIEVKIRPMADYALNLYNDDMGGQIVTNDTLAMDISGGETSVTLSAMLLDVANMFDDPADVTWKTSAATVAALNATEGSYVTVSVLKAGTATITATGKNPNTGAVMTAKVTIKASKLVNALEITSKTETFTVASGKTLTLTATAFPTDAALKTVTWSLLPGDEAFATISTTGALKAKENLTEPVTVTVVATAKDGSGVTAEAVVTIMPVVQGMDIWMENEGVITGTTLVWDMGTNPVLTVHADTYPDFADKNVTWKSSSAAIAEIDAETGVILCKKAGTATITATANDGSGKSATFKLTVVKFVTDLNLEDQTIAGGKILNLANMIQILESDATNKKLTWTLSGDGSETDGTAFATLSATGSLTTKAVTGAKRVTVTAATTDGSCLEASCVITITPAVTAVNIYDGETLVNGKTITMGVGEMMDLTAVNNPEGALQDWTWTSNNAAVEVDNNGHILVVTAGKSATITAKANDGSAKSATVTIKTVQKMEELKLPADAVVASTKSISLTAAVAPADTTTKTLKWSIISGSDYATIDNSGKLTAKALAGDSAAVVTVMATSTDGSNLSAITKVMITPLTAEVHIMNAEGMEVKNETLYIDEEMMYLTGFSAPAGAAQTYTWTVSNATYAAFAVDEGYVGTTTGTSVLLAGLTPGKAVTVTATATDGSGKKASFRVNTAQRMQELTLPETAVVGEGKTLTLRANVLPANTTNKTLTWELLGVYGVKDGMENRITLSPAGVLKVGTGVLEAGSTATVEVGVSSNDGSGLYKTCQITIHPLTTVVQISDYYSGEEIKGTIKLPVGEYFHLDALGFYKDSNGDLCDAADEFTWKTGNSNYVSFVDYMDNTYSSVIGSDTVIMAMKPGAVITVTATANDGSGRQAAVRIQTVQPVTGITLDNQAVTPGRSITLKPVIEPANASNKQVIWDISGYEDYATINQYGVLTAKANVEGVQDIVVTAYAADDYGAYAECTVTVAPRTTNVTVWTEGQDITGTIIDLYMPTEERENTRWVEAFSDPWDAYGEYTWQISNSNYAAFEASRYNEETGEDERYLTNKIVGEGAILRSLVPGKTVTVTATAMDGTGKRATFRVRTLQAVETMSLKERYLVGGRSMIVGFDVYPQNASNVKADWEVAYIYDEYGSPLNEEDVLIRLGNVIYAKPTDRIIYVGIYARSQDGAAELYDEEIQIVPETVGKIDVYEQRYWEDDEYPTEGIVVLGEGEEIRLIGYNKNVNSVHMYNWRIADTSIIKFYGGEIYDEESGEWVDLISESSEMEDHPSMIMKAMKPGVTTVTLEALDGSGKTASVKIIVKEYIPV